MRLLLPLLLSSVALAQINENYTAYSIDALPGAYGHWAFFGVLSGGGSDECRAQMVVPAAFLPAAGGLILAIEVSAHVNGTVTYQQLDLQLGTAAFPTLTSDMNANLPAPQTVYSASPGTAITWPVLTQWARINLTTPFVYQGGTNLVLESRRVVQRPATPPTTTVSHQMSNSPFRTDLPRPVWAEGGAGSGSANAQFGSFGGSHMLVRFVFAAAPTLTVTGPLVNGLCYRAGQTMTVSVQGNPNELAGDVIDLGLGTPTVYPFVQGFYYLSGFTVFFVGLLDGSGLGSVPIAIPANPSLAGLHVYFQAATGSASFVWTNAVDAILQPI